MTKQQLIDYVMDSPQNTNPAILGQMVDEVGGSGDVVLGPQLLYSGNINDSNSIEFLQSEMEERVLNQYLKMPTYYKISYQFNNNGEFLELPLDRNSGIDLSFSEELHVEGYYQYIDANDNYTRLSLMYQSVDELWSTISYDTFPEGATTLQIYIEYVPEGI